MPPAVPKTSPTLQRLIADGLFDRLPVTFSAFFFDQIKDWDLLFPAERSYFERLFSLLARSDRAAVNQLFEPLRQLEQKMGVTDKSWPKGQFSLDQVDFLNRSPHYAEWRTVISGIFVRLDPILDEEVATNGRPRLAIVISPGEIPVGPDRLWLRIAQHGRRIRLTPPEDISNYVPVLLTGQPREKGAPSIASDYVRSRASSSYDCWTVEAESEMTHLAAGVQFSYAALEKYRSRLMTEVGQIVEKESIRGPRQLGARLKQMKLLESESSNAKDPILAEFGRAVLLTGNGTLLINNTFVEWATVQAVRRARPSLAVVSFGIRNKMKPFSSLLIYTDQEQASPIPTQMDTLGTYVDLEIFYQYIWQEFEKYPEYRRNTMYLFAGVGLDELLLIAPPDCALLNEPQPVTLARVNAIAREWLGA
jgi:hypothetical protein